MGSDASEDSRESRRSPTSRHEREDDEPLERSVKDRSGGGATKPLGDNGTEGCSSWLAPVGRGGAVVSTCMQSHPGTTALRVAPYGSHFGRTLALPSPALGSRPQPPSRAVPGARDNEESRYASHQSVAIMRRVVTPHVHPWQSRCLNGNHRPSEAIKVWHHGASDDGNLGANLGVDLGVDLGVASWCLKGNSSDPWPSDRHLRSSSQVVISDRHLRSTSRTCMDLCEAESIHRGTRSPGAVVEARSSGT